ncbi:MAG: tetratricopeptide repeat protein [Thermodesulfovibrionales bacterium]|nr:tetratricopeptide repeat protein [Thermodesulfovibrionales bacterium]
MDWLNNTVNIFGHELPLGVIFYGLIAVLMLLLVILVVKRRKAKAIKVIQEPTPINKPSPTNSKEETVVSVKEETKKEPVPEPISKDSRVDELQADLNEIKEKLQESINKLQDKTRLFHVLIPEIRLIEDIEDYNNKGLTTIDLRDTIDRLFEAIGLKETLLSPLMTISQPTIRESNLLNYISEKIEEIDDAYKSKVFKIDHYLMIGCFFAQRGFYDKAKAWYQKAREVNQYHFEPVYNCAVINFKQDKIEEANSELSNILSDNTKEPFPFLLKALILTNNANYEEGLQYFSKSLQCNPLNSDVWYEKGLLLMNLERFKDALDCFENAINTNPRDDRAWQAKGIAHSRLGMQEDAFRAYEQALSIKPEDEESWYGKAIALSYIGLHEEALKSFDFALSINKDNFKASFGKGLALFYLKRYDEALIAFENTININGNYSRAWYNKAIVHCINNQLDETLFSLRKAIELNEKYKTKAQIEEEFQKIRDNEDFKRLCGIEETQKE